MWLVLTLRSANSSSPERSARGSPHHPSHLPNCFRILSVQATFGIASAILAAATLSFGMGAVAHPE